MGRALGRHGGHRGRRVGLPALARGRQVPRQARHQQPHLRRHARLHPLARDGLRRPRPRQGRRAEARHHDLRRRPFRPQLQPPRQVQRRGHHHLHRRDRPGHGSAQSDWAQPSARDLASRSRRRHASPSIASPRRFPRPFRSRPSRRRRALDPQLAAPTGPRKTRSVSSSSSASCRKARKAASRAT
mgnify:CR=1 FL=1